jgi:hypothetical protein
VLSVLVQLSGVPGSGKSTLARGLSEALGLVVLNTDVVKSALLSRDLGVEAAGPASYGVVLALAADLLAQGHQVVIDSPCRYPALLESGQGGRGGGTCAVPVRRAARRRPRCPAPPP